MTGEIIDQKELAERLLAQAKEQGGPGGPLSGPTGQVLGTGLKAELTEIGPARVEVLRDREGSSEPVILLKRKPSSRAHRPDCAFPDQAGSDERIGRRALPTWECRPWAQPFYVVMGVATNEGRDIPGIWAGHGAEGARF